MTEATTTGHIPVHDREFKRCPYPFYDEIRAEGGLRRLDVPDGAPGWFVTGYEQARALLADPRMSKNSAYGGPEWHRRQPQRDGERSRPLFRHLLTLDAPEHTRLRATVQREFTSGRVRAMRPLVQQITDDLVDAMRERGGGDLLDDFAVPMALMVICLLLGVPFEDRAEFRAWSAVLVASEQAGAEAVMAAGDAMRGYLGDLMRRKVAEPDGTLYSGLAASCAAGELTEEDVVSMGFLLLVAGHETTVNLVGNGMAELLGRPERFGLLRAEPELIPGAVEEFLRFAGSLEVATPRFATQDVEIGGVRIERGETVYVVLGAAGHDPARWPDPDALDLRRDATGHLAFGHGAHYCVGAPLARLEGHIAFETLLRRLPSLRLAVPAEELSVRPGLIMRGLERLPVTCAQEEER